MVTKYIFLDSFTFELNVATNIPRASFIIIFIKDTAMTLYDTLFSVGQSLSATHIMLFSCTTMPPSHNKIGSFEEMKTICLNTHA